MAASPPHPSRHRLPGRLQQVRGNQLPQHPADLTQLGQAQLPAAGLEPGTRPWRPGMGKMPGISGKNHGFFRIVAACFRIFWELIYEIMGKIICDHVFNISKNIIIWYGQHLDLFKRNIGHSREVVLKDHGTKSGKSRYGAANLCQGTRWCDVAGSVVGSYNWSSPEGRLIEAGEAINIINPVPRAFGWTTTFMVRYRTTSRGEKNCGILQLLKLAQVSSQLRPKPRGKHTNTLGFSGVHQAIFVDWTIPVVGFVCTSKSKGLTVWQLKLWLEVDQQKMR